MFCIQLHLKQREEGLQDSMQKEDTLVLTRYSDMHDEEASTLPSSIGEKAYDIGCAVPGISKNDLTAAGNSSSTRESFTTANPSH